MPDLYILEPLLGDVYLSKSLIQIILNVSHSQGIVHLRTRWTVNDMHV